MKKTLFLTLMILWFFGMQSCKDKDKDPVLNLSDITAPNLLYPENDQTIVLYEADTSNLFPEFEWSETDYNFSGNLAKTTYALQMSVNDSEFGSFSTLTNTDTTYYSVTVGAFNTRLLSMDLQPDTSYSIYFRIASFVVSLGSEETAYSETIKLNITPFEAVIVLPPIYLLGDATTVGWDNVNALEVPYVGSGVFRVVQTLGANLYYKAISKRGQWAPQWGKNTGTWEGGTLKYRATDSDPDPDAIPSPPTEGLYEITIDTAQMLYSVVPVDE